ncbi:MAG: hypothetical protein WCC64_09925 [Aliidongia sp.]
MLTAEQIATLEDLVDHDLRNTAHAAYAAATQRQAGLQPLIAEAEAKLKAATAARTALLSRAAGGGIVEAQESADAERTMREAADRVTFAKDSAPHIAEEVRRLHDELTKASRDSYLPVIRHGAKLRLEAAARLDRARADLAEAEAAYDAASDIVAYGDQRYRSSAYLVPGTVQIPPHQQKTTYLLRHGAAAEAALWRSSRIEVE